MPEIHCPDDITVNLPNNKNKAVLGMLFTEASTNMDTWETNPRGIDAEYGFGLGTHKVEYIARNKYGDIAKCSYQVEVVGEYSENLIKCVVKHELEKVKEVMDLTVKTMVKIQINITTKLEGTNS